jgi:membrane associated rhomboid family serine protease
MDLVIQPQHWSAFVVIGVILSTLIITRVKKTMVTYALIVANIVVFILTLIFYYELVLGFSGGLAYAGLGFRGMYLTIEQSPQLYTLFTSMFIHGDFLHLLGNMLVFFFMGMAFEQRIGWKRFLVIYLLTGICGSITHVLIEGNATIPLIGASGAIFGILGAFAFSYPRDEVVMPIPLIFIMVFRRIKVMYAALLFGAMETAFVFFGGRGNTAHFAHLGGIISGVIIAAILLRNIKMKETIQSSQESLYYDASVPKKPSAINIDALRSIARTPEQLQMVEKIEQETVPQVRDVWLEHFVEKTPCPQCGKVLNHFDKKIWCENCGFRTKY